jgi:hypothetical protein
MDITNKYIFSIVIFSLWLIVYMTVGVFAGWDGAIIVGIAFSAWLIIRTEIRKKSGTFNGSLL